MGKAPKNVSVKCQTKEERHLSWKILYMHSRCKKRSYFAYSIWSDKKAHDTTLNMPIYETVTESPVLYLES